MLVNSLVITPLRVLRPGCENGKSQKMKMRNENQKTRKKENDGEENVHGAVEIGEEESDDEEESDHEVESEYGVENEPVEEANDHAQLRFEEVNARVELGIGSVCVEGNVHPLDGWANVHEVVGHGRRHHAAAKGNVGVVVSEDELQEQADS